LRFNRGHGIRLKKIFHSVFNSAETVSTSTDNAAGNIRVRATAYDNDNRFYPATGGDGVVRPKVNTFYTMLDNERIQEFNLTCASFDDYKLLKDKLAESMIQSSDMYYYNWFWIEDFSAISDNKLQQRI